MKIKHLLGNPITGVSTNGKKEHLGQRTLSDDSSACFSLFDVNKKRLSSHTNRRFVSARLI